jgi:enamine deaminase RidA (YjgF/YER057c/UK114 family)
LIESEKEDLRKQVLIAFQNDDIDTALEEIGAYMKDRIRDRILSNEVTPHSKKIGITLFDTGQLVSSIDYEVK